MGSVLDQAGPGGMIMLPTYEREPFPSWGNTEGILCSTPHWEGESTETIQPGSHGEEGSAKAPRNRGALLRAHARGPCMASHNNSPKPTAFLPLTGHTLELWTGQQPLSSP